MEISYSYRFYRKSTGRISTLTHNYFTRAGFQVITATVCSYFCTTVAMRCITNRSVFQTTTVIWKAPIFAAVTCFDREKKKNYQNKKKTLKIRKDII
jgi:hypothetical protein